MPPAFASRYDGAVTPSDPPASLLAPTVQPVSPVPTCTAHQTSPASAAASCSPRPPNQHPHTRSTATDEQQTQEMNTLRLCTYINHTVYKLEACRRTHGESRANESERSVIAEAICGGTPSHVFFAACSASSHACRSSLRRTTQKNSIPDTGSAAKEPAHDVQDTRHAGERNGYSNM